MRIGIVVPHIFMHQDILPHVIFSPGTLALDLAHGLQKAGAEVTLFSPGPVNITGSRVRNITADLSYFQQELEGRGDSYIDLLKKHPFTFITLARQVQSEVIAKAYDMANNDELDIVHIYTNEEDIALPFAKLCRKPVVFTNHDPFNFLVKYKNVFPKYRHLNWLSISYDQRKGMPDDTNWLANIYHGADATAYTPVESPDNDYVVCLGRIIQSKGTHLAITAIEQYNHDNPSQTLKLKLAGKHYSGKKDDYWLQHIEPKIDNTIISYEGFVGDTEAKRQLLANAKAIIVPSTFQEPFGMVMIEALACGTPIIGLASGAIPEVIKEGQTGFVVLASDDETTIAIGIAQAISKIDTLDRTACRQDFEERFTLDRMVDGHREAYSKLL
jgi:glycosyltransferase involved in cell wall biosynthesis